MLFGHVRLAAFYGRCRNIFQAKMAQPPRKYWFARLCKQLSACILSLHTWPVRLDYVVDRVTPAWSVTDLWCNNSCSLESHQTFHSLCVI